MKKSLTITISLFGLLVIVCLAAAVIADRYVSHQAQTVATLTAQAVTDQNQVQALQSEQASNNALSPDIAQINAYPISADGEVSFIDQVESIAHGLNLAITISSVGINPAADLSSVGLENLNIQLAVTGSWSSVYRFTDEVENLPYDISVNQADFSSLSDNSGNLAWQGTFNISAIKKISPTESN